MSESGGYERQVHVPQLAVGEHVVPLPHTGWSGRFEVTQLCLNIRGGTVGIELRQYRGDHVGGALHYCRAHEVRRLSAVERLAELTGVET